MPSISAPRFGQSLQGQRLTIVFAFVAALGCAEKSGPAKPGPTNGPDTVGGTQDVPKRPRIVLDAELRASLAASAKAKSAAFVALERKCNAFATDRGGGYLGLEWAEAVFSLSICWHATGNEKWATLAVRYLEALLDDRERIGDGRGGDEVVRRDSGYAIRSHAFGAALGYDWLYNAKAMTPAIQARIASRLSVWLDWYAKSGYLRDNPFSNYFWGYMSSLAVAGLALEGDADEAGTWLKQSRELLETMIVPAFAKKLEGGGWAEGWQYGGAVSMASAMVVRGFATAKGIDYAAKLPWFGEIVRNQLHRLTPSRKISYGNGTNEKKPAPPTRTPLHAAIVVIAKSQPELAGRARFVDNKLLGEERVRYPWLAMLAAATGTAESDALADEPLSYHLAGPGITFARSSWNRKAVWTAFQAGPRIAVDHQHNDQGHFELWRGADALFVDGGNAHAYATINHNTVLIDDAKRTLRFAPNQGVWGQNAKTVGFSDDGRVVVAIGDIASAWDPKCVVRGCEKRTVAKAIRTFIFVRPNVLVIEDQIELTSETDRVRWAGNVLAAPQTLGNKATVEVGGSRADVSLLEPVGAGLRATKVERGGGKHIYEHVKPLGDVWRIESSATTGTRERRFVVWLEANNRGAAAKSAKRLETSYVRASGEQPISVTFAKAAQGAAFSFVEGTVVIVGLVPGASYKLSSVPDRNGCKVAFASDAASPLAASKAGALSVTLDGCTIKK